MEREYKITYYRIPRGLGVVLTSLWDGSTHSNIEINKNYNNTGHTLEHPSGTDFIEEVIHDDLTRNQHQVLVDLHKLENYYP